jgi:poly(3-hydroxybutyrate) depolymerase
MLIRISQFLFIANYSILILNFSDSPAQAKPKAEYMVIFKSNHLVIHVFVPESYDPKKEYPLLLALHSNNNTGQSFLPNLQLEAAKKQWIVACPDSNNVDTWDTIEFQKDLNILKRTFRKLKNHFHLDPKKHYLLGDQSGGYFLLFLLTKEPIFLKDFMGIIVINTETQSAFENKLWSTHIQKKEPKPILYLQARDHPNIVYLRAQWTRDWFRNKGFPVRYVEESSFGGGYPFHLNQKIFDWCENKKSDGDEIKNDPLSTPMPLSKEFEILSFKKTSSEHSTASSVKRIRVGTSQTNYDLSPSGAGNFRIP